MENIIKIVLWTKLPEFSFHRRSQGRKAFSTIGYKSQPLPDPGQHHGKESPLGWNLCCAIKTFVLIVQTGTYWGKPLIFWHKMILAGAENLSLGLRVNNVPSQLSSIHFDWRAFFMSFTSIYKEGGKQQTGIMKWLHLEKLKDNHPHQRKDKLTILEMKWVNWHLNEELVRMPETIWTCMVPWQIMCLVDPRVLGSKVIPKQQWL